MKQRLEILMVDDEPIVHTTVGDYLTDLGHAVDHAHDGEEGAQKIAEREYDLAIVDIRMPKMDGLSLLKQVQTSRPDQLCVILTAHAQMDIAIDAMRSGAVDFLTKPVKLVDLDVVLERAKKVRALMRDKRHLRETIGGMQTSERTRMASRGLIGTSAQTNELRAQVALAVEALVDTVLITGETGTGKEVVARELHFGSEGDDSPFIAVNCPALPETLAESELFGHMKGAFTGATADRAGYFELADGGTLFLDEVADLSASTQASLLRALETRLIRRVGGKDEKPVRVRIVAATNADLDKAMADGTFRSDLYHRLNVYRLHLTPLRERREDILPLATSFLSSYVESRGLDLPALSAEGLDRLMAYDYPGNARELRNIVERAAILCRSCGEIHPDHLHLAPGAPVLPPAAPPPAPAGTPASGDKERARIEAALTECKWNRRKASALLKMPYSTLRYKMGRLGIGRD